MAKAIPINERFQHFVEEMQESFWEDLYGAHSASVERVLRIGVGAPAGPLCRQVRSMSEGHGITSDGMDPLSPLTES